MEQKGEIAERLSALKKMRLELLDSIQRDKVALDKIDYAISILDGSAAPSLPFSQSVSVTNKGSIRNLTAVIIDELKERGVVMTASEMANAMYGAKMMMSPDQLRRRVSVKTSAMFKKSDPPQIADSGLKNKRREIYWALPQWMNPEGKIDKNRLPDEINVRP